MRSNTVHHPQKLALREFNQSLTRLSPQPVMAPEVIFESETASHAGVMVQCTIDKKPVLHEFNHSLTHALVSKAGHGA
jgi:hypothetical protein